MKKLCAVMAVTVLLIISQNVTAETLVIDVDGEGLLVTQWETREVSTKKWRPGCMQYDFLQRTGWAPRTWHDNLEPKIIEDDLYVFETSSGFGRWYCGAEMDEYNYVELELITDAGETYRGRFKVIPGGESDDAVISCTLGEPPILGDDVAMEPPAERTPVQIWEDNAIVCENPVVAWGEYDEYYIEVLFD